MFVHGNIGHEDIALSNWPGCLWLSLWMHWPSVQRNLQRKVSVLFLENFYFYPWIHYNELFNPPKCCHILYFLFIGYYGNQHHIYLWGNLINVTLGTYIKLFVWWTFLFFGNLRFYSHSKTCTRVDMVFL